MYRRVLIKLSGEALFGSQTHIASEKVRHDVAVALRELNESGVQVALVIGGGNIIRGIQGDSLGIERVAADRLGMLSTLINSLVFQQVCLSLDTPCSVFSAIRCDFVDFYDRDKVIQSLERGHIVILAGGTGLPFFSTDTAAALRAIEIRAELLLKATKVDGVYDKDPLRFPDATKFSHLSFSQLISENLEVMDLAAATLCREHHLPIVVFDLFESENLKRAVAGQRVGTLISEPSSFRKGVNL